MKLNFQLKDSKTQYIFAALLIFFAVFLLFHDLFFGKIIATNDVSTSDLLYFYLPVKKLYADALRNGELLQWTPMIYGGFPVFAESQGGFLYPLNLVIWYLLSPVTAMNFYIIFHALLMGAGVYLLVSNITKNKLVSIPAAMAASVCGSIIVGHTRHMNSLTAIVYLPMLIYIVELFLKTRKISWGLVFGILLGFLILGGHPQHTFISGFFAIVYLFTRLLTDKRSGPKISAKENSYKIAGFLALALVICLVVGIAQINSTLEILPYTERGQNLSAEFTGQGSLPFNGFMTFIYPYYFGNAGDDSYHSRDIYLFWEYFYYCGVIIFLLSIYGAVKMWKRAEFRSYIRTFAIIALLSYLLALGENLGLYKIFLMFPFTNSFRFPARWFVGTELSILVLSGFGVLALVERFSGIRNPAAKSGKKPLPKGTPKAPAQVTTEKASISVQYKTVLVISLLAVFEIFIVAGRQVTTADAAVYLNPPSYVNKIVETNKPVLSANRFFSVGWKDYLLEAFDRSRGWEGKQDLFGLGAKLIPPELGAYWGAPSIDGYFLLVPNYIYEVWANSNNPGVMSKTTGLDKANIFHPAPKFNRMLKMFSVKYVASAWPFSQPYQPAWDSAGVKFYEMPDTVTKTWVVSKVQAYPTADDNFNAKSLITDDFDPWSLAYVNGTAPNLPPDSRNGTAEILKYDNHSVTIKANAPGFVVLNDTWYPRWKAYIDGAEVPVYKTDVMIRGVVAPKAGTIIEMKFDKGNVFILSIISYLTVLLSAGYLFFEKKRDKSKIKESKTS